ncbi:TatD family hydrolase [Rhizosaccharibacter radicis]|uniref:TatD family hydrolase n=1 Tax=Rhizosaccharibacter radicis TaxID=2782605 RepID=A0ABT1VYN9_9PROT|nr:TatD family hydrolase [Acetobacteraceae bacterium KSS12]
MLIDSHCHLDLLPEEERDAILDRAEQAGLSGLVTIGTRLSRAAVNIGLTALSRPTLDVWCTIGTHPDNAHTEDQDADGLASLAASAPGVIGIGESGLDYFHGAPDVRPAQQRSFRAHIAAARETGLPLVIHARAADEDMIAMLERAHAEDGSFPFLLHCFSSGAALAECGVRLGGYVSFSGILTFPKSDELRAIARAVPEDRLLVETDAPYLAPVPVRGKQNEPGFVAHTARRLAEERGVAAERLAEITTGNFRRLFKVG